MRIQYDWQNAIWKILTHPAFEVVAAIVAVLVAAWFLIDTQLEHPAARLPQNFGLK